MNAAHWTDRPVVVLGARGMLGTDLVSSLRVRLDDTAASVLAWDQEELEITDAAAVEAALVPIAPGVVINCAAYTDVDGCESNVALAMAVNAEAPGIVGRVCRGIDALLVQVGTDFIFDGRSSRPYRPEAPANPLSVYGRSKWDGEEAVRASGCHHLIVRTSWLYGLRGRNFVEAILQKAEAGQALRVVNDQVGRPTYTMDLSEAIVRLLDVGAMGLVNFANEGQCSWHGFAEAIVELARLKTPVTAISSTELNRPARRPAYSVLDLSRYKELTSRAVRPWQEALSEYLIRREAGGEKS